MRRAALIAALLAAPLPALAQDDHAGHAPPAGPAAPAPTPTPPGDHAADRVFDPARMAAARATIRHENGGMNHSMVLVDRLERRWGAGAGGYAWEGEAWFGPDLDRLVLKTEGEGASDGGVEEAAVQALYSRAIDPWFNLQAGLRYDIRPRPDTAYAVVGIEGLAPYWFEVEGAVFLSQRGDVSARLEASHDFRLTQRWLLTPRAEAELAAQDVPELEEGAGLVRAGLGLRLHYAVSPRLTPYVGVEWERAFGQTARLARRHGDAVDDTRLVVGLRGWF